MISYTQKILCTNKSKDGKRLYSEGFFNAAMNVIGLGPSVFMKVKVHFSGGRKSIFLFGSLNYIEHK